MTTNPNRAYRRTLLAGGAALLLTFAAASRGLARLAVERPTIGEFVGACRTLLPTITPTSLAALAVLSVAATSLLCGLRMMIEVVVAGRAARAVCDGGVRCRIAGEPVTVIPDTRPYAFCVGLVRPVIVVSRGALDCLAEREVEAVITHEAAHVRRRDPLRLAVLAVLSDALFFLPLIRRLASRHATLAEIAADSASAGRAGRPALARALLVFTDVAVPAVTAGIDAQRLDALLDRPSRFALSVGAVLGSGVTLLALAALAAVGGSDGQAGAAGETARTCILVLLGVPIVGAIVAFVRPWRLRLR